MGENIFFSELILSRCSSINFELIHGLHCFPEMEQVNFYQTKIDFKRLELCLVHMPKLKHINIGNSYCKNLILFNLMYCKHFLLQIIRKLSIHQLK